MRYFSYFLISFIKLSWKNSGRCIWTKNWMSLGERQHSREKCKTSWFTDITANYDGSVTMAAQSGRPGRCSKKIHFEFGVREWMKVLIRYESVHGVTEPAIQNCLMEIYYPHVMSSSKALNFFWMGF